MCLALQRGGGGPTILSWGLTPIPGLNCGDSTGAMKVHFPDLLLVEGLGLFFQHLFNAPECSGFLLQAAYFIQASRRTNYCTHGVLSVGTDC